MSEQIDQFISGLLDDIKNNRVKLPTLPQVAMKVSDALRDPDSTAKSVAKLISTDAALTAKVIQVSNSAFARGNSKVENVQMAVSRLGMKLVKNLVTSLLIRQLFHTKYPSLKKRMEKLWLHSTRVGALSYVFAKKYTVLAHDEALLGGLIHDIGELPILAHAEKFPDIATDDEKLDEIITNIKPALGKMMLKMWGFPPEILKIAEECEKFDRNPSDSPDYTDVILVANLHAYMGTNHPLSKVNWAEVPALKKLGLDPEGSLQVMKEAKDEIMEVQQLLS